MLFGKFDSDRDGFKLPNPYSTWINKEDGLEYKAMCLEVRLNPENDYVHSVTLTVMPVLKHEVTNSKVLQCTIEGLYSSFTEKPPINQCDGCQAGMELTSLGNHISKNGTPYMVCQKKRYENSTGAPELYTRVEIERWRDDAFAAALQLAKRGQANPIVLEAIEAMIKDKSILAKKEMNGE